MLPMKTLCVSESKFLDKTRNSKSLIRQPLGHLGWWIRSLQGT